MTTLLLLAASWAPALLAQPAAVGPPVSRPRPADCPRAPETEPREIRVGSCLRSTLGEGDPVVEGGIRYEDYRLTLGAGEAVRIDLDAISAGPSGGFDTYLEIRRAGEEEPIRTNDDRPDSLNSTLIFAPPAAGQYLVRARGLGPAGGDFALSVVPAPATRIREIRFDGEPMRSAIEVNDAQEGDRYYEEYRLRLSRNDIVQIDMEAVQERRLGEPFLDPYLAIFAPRETRPLATNDDRGGSLNARLVFVVPANGTYRVRAQGYRYSVGEYTLATARLAEMPRPNLLVDDQAAGTWYDGSPATERDGQPVRFMEYRFEGRERERVQFDAASNPRPRLMLARVDGFWFAEQIAPSRGIGPRSSARLTAVLPRTGAYLVRLEVPGAESGDFQLRLTRLPDAPLGEPLPLDRERATEGRLGLDSGLIAGDDGTGQVQSFYRIYALQMQAGETVTVALESEDFDPVLDAGTLSNLGYAVALSNDDSEGRNARLVLTQADSGTLHLRARSRSGTVGEGRFTLRVVPGAPPPPPAAAPRETRMH